MCQFDGRNDIMRKMVRDTEEKTKENLESGA